MSFVDLGTEEVEFYKTANPDDVIKLPITRLGLESLLSRVSEMEGFPNDDTSMQVLCGYIHHIPRDESRISLSTAALAIRKQLCNLLTFNVDREIGEKRKAQLEDEQRIKGPALVLAPNETTA